MYKLKRLNAVRIVDTEVKRDALIKQGYILLDGGKTAMPDKYGGFTLKELKKLAETRGVDVHGLTKAADIKAALIAADDAENDGDDDGEEGD